MDERDEHRLALMALHVGVPPGAPAGPAPSDEELAALLEQRLDATRRAQVLADLLADEALYARWFALREGLAWTGDVAAPQPAASHERAPARGWLAAWLHGVTRCPALGGALAAGVLAVMLLPAALRPDYAGDIDRLFEGLPDLAQRGHELPAPEYATRAAPSLAPRGPLRTQLEQGMLEGMERVGPGFALQGIERAHLARASMRDRVARLVPSRRAAFELGRFTVAASIQCLAGGEHTRYPGEVAHLRAMRADLPQDGEEAAVLARALAPLDSPYPEIAVCASTLRIVEWVSRGDVSS